MSSQDVNNDGLDRPVRRPRAMSRPCPTSRLAIQAISCWAGRTAQFVEQAPAAGIEDFARARGAAVVDLNADGLLDIVVVVRRENVRLWRNLGAGTAETLGAMGNWLSSEARDDGAKSRRDRLVDRGSDAATERRPARSRSVAATSAGETRSHAFRSRAPRRAREIRVTWPDGEVGPGSGCRPTPCTCVTRSPPTSRRSR